MNLFFLELIVEFNKDDMSKEELVVIDVCEVIAAIDAVYNEIELFIGIEVIIADVELAAVVYEDEYVLSFTTKIKEETICK